MDLGSGFQKLAGIHCFPSEEFLGAFQKKVHDVGELVVGTVGVERTVGSEIQQS